MDKDKPHWFGDHEADDLRNFGEIQAALNRIEAKIDPVYDAYTTATTLGRWTKVLGSAILMALALWAAIKQLY